MAAAIAGSGAGSVTTTNPDQLQQSFASASTVAAQNPKVRDADHAAAQSSFLDGANWAYAAGIIAILLGAALVFFLFPKHADEVRLLLRLRAEDADGQRSSTKRTAEVR